MADPQSTLTIMAVFDGLYLIPQIAFLLMALINLSKEVIFLFSGARAKQLSLKDNEMKIRKIWQFKMIFFPRMFFDIRVATEIMTHIRYRIIFIRRIVNLLCYYFTLFPI